MLLCRPTLYSIAQKSEYTVVYQCTTLFYCSLDGQDSLWIPVRCGECLVSEQLSIFYNARMSSSSCQSVDAQHKKVSSNEHCRPSDSTPCDSTSSTTNILVIHFIAGVHLYFLTPNFQHTRPYFLFFAPCFLIRIHIRAKKTTEHHNESHKPKFRIGLHSLEETDFF